VIHGVGNGKLKQEILAILKTVDGIEYFDASYKDYGYGATEIRIY
jgi:dsDNA-specific endonuclease/ATPase MutS2